MGKKLEEMEEQLEKREQEQEKKAKLFRIDEVLEDTEEVKSAYIPELDMTVEYGPLTMGDLEDIAEAEGDEERGKRVLWKMLNKADPNVTLEKVNRLKLETAIPILNRILRPLGELAPEE